VLTPVAIHRRLSGHRVKGRVVASGHILIRVALGLLVLLVASVAAFIFHVVASPTAAVVAGAALAVLMISLHFVLPTALVRSRDH
jgi:membrane protein YdbS with pleckstrin-like domain